MMLCDSVFAIAITLLATEVRAPEAWSGDWTGLWGPLAGQLDAYAMSFLVISIYWLAHRRFMASLWGYAALIAKVVPSEVGTRPRWFILLLIVATPPFFLLLTLSVPNAGPGVMPIGLSLLFLIGWRLRRWTIGRLGGKAHIG